MNTKTTFTPSVRADYSWIKNDSYNETGAGVLNLNVDDNTSDRLTAAVDGKLNHRFTDRLTGAANLGVGYDIIQSDQSLVAAYAAAPGSAFTAYGINPPAAGPSAAAQARL